MCSHTCGKERRQVYTDRPSHVQNPENQHGYPTNVSIAHPGDVSLEPVTLIAFFRTEDAMQTTASTGALPKGEQDGVRDFRFGYAKDAIGRPYGSS